MAFPQPFGLDRRTFGVLFGVFVTESDEGRWLTYIEVGELLGVSSSAARMFAKRHGWARRTPNAYGERAQVLVPPGVDVQPRSASYPEHTGTRSPLIRRTQTATIR